MRLKELKESCGRAEGFGGIYGTVIYPPAGEYRYYGMHVPN